MVESFANRCAAIAALAGTCGVSFAQDVWRATPPQYYSWERNPAADADPQDPADDYVHDARFMAMLRVELNSTTTPTQAAQQTIMLLNERITEQAIAPYEVAITIQNFGSHDVNAYRNAKFSFLRDSDKVTLTADTLLLPQAIRLVYEVRQPWMDTAVGEYDAENDTFVGGEATEWMAEYCAILNVLLTQQPYDQIPIRFHFDIEANLFGGSMNNAILRVMRACEADSRWATLEVPGYGGQTMLQIWNAAQDEYGWRATGQPYKTIAEVIPDDNNASANQPAYQKYAMWWQSVCTRAMAEAVKIACEGPIKNTWPNALVGNYNHWSADMGESTFAFRALSANTSEPTNVFRRGTYPINERGAYPYVVATSTTSGAPPLMYDLGINVSRLDFDSPVLYYFDPADFGPTQAGNWIAARHPKWYEPPVAGNHPTESWAEVLRRSHRHAVDSILNTPSRRPEGVVPWIAFPDVLSVDEFDTLAGIDEVRRLLALLRSKDIREVALWSNKPVVVGGVARGDGIVWNLMKRADAQVFTSSYNDYQLVRGSDLAASSGEYGVPTPLMNTLSDVDRPTVDIESEALDSNSNVTEFVVWLNDIDPQTLGLNGRLLLECQLVPLDPGQNFDIDEWREGVVGKISIWRPGSEDWAPLVSVNDVGNKGDYHFYVPDVSTRREWDIGVPEAPDPLCEYLENCVGPMAIKFTHIAPAASTAGFVSKYDLVQFYHIDDFAQWSSMMAGAPSTDPYLAADFNYDGVQDSMDLALFTTAWTSLRRSADYNADGVVDTTDLTQFLAAAARTSPTGVDSDW